MSKNDYSKTKPSLWKNHENIEFSSPRELLKWVSDDKQNHHLSKKVFEAVIDCVESNIDSVVVATINVMGMENDGIHIQIQKNNFQKIISGYTKRLMENEDYEILAEIKPSIEKYGFEISE